MLQQTIFLNDCKKAEMDTSSLPRLIEFMQYVKTWDGDIRDRVGSIGKSNFAYSLIFDNDFDASKEKSGLKKLKRMLLNRYVIKITRDEIFDAFFVYEIPDYSNQAATVGFSDFDVECYDSNGMKIFNGIIAILKSFTNKKAYVLIDKSYITQVSNFDKIDIIVEPKMIVNPENFENFDKSFLKADGIDNKTGKITYKISNNDSKDNRTQLYSNDPLDYDVCIKQTVGNQTKFVKIDQSAYRLKIHSGFEYLLAYTSYQTSTNHDAFPPNSNKYVYHGDYFKQIMTAFVQQMNQHIITGSTKYLSKNLEKFLPVIGEDDETGDNIRDSLIIELDLDVNLKHDDVVLTTKQFVKKYSQVIPNKKLIDLSQSKIFKYEDFEIFHYPIEEGVQSHIGKKLSRHDDYTHSLNDSNPNPNNGFTGISLTADATGIYELKIHNDNKRATNIYIEPKPDPETGEYSILFNILDYLYSKKYYKFNIDLSKADIRCYINGMYHKYPFVAEVPPNTIKIENTQIKEDGDVIQIQIRDFSHGDEKVYLVDYTENTPEYDGTTPKYDGTTTLVEEGFDRIDENTNIMDVGLNILDEHILSDIEKSLLEENEIILNEYDKHLKQVFQSDEIGYIIDSTGGLNISDKSGLKTSTESGLTDENIPGFMVYEYAALLSKLEGETKDLSETIFKEHQTSNSEISDIKEMCFNISNNSNFNHNELEEYVAENGIKMKRDEGMFIFLKFDGAAENFNYRVYDGEDLIYKELTTSIDDTGDDTGVGIILPYSFDFSSGSKEYKYIVEPDDSSTEIEYYIFGGA